MPDVSVQLSSGEEFVWEMVRQLQDQADLVLVCRDGRVPCHAAVLAAGGDLWTQVLHSEEEELHVSIPWVNTMDMRSVLSLLYTGSCHQMAGLEDILVTLFPKVKVGSTKSSLLPVHSTYTTCEDKMGEDDESYSGEMSEYTQIKEEATPEPLVLIDTWTEFSSESAEDDMLGGGENSHVKIDPSILEPKKSTTAKSLDYACSFCGKRFLYPKDLRNHIMIHQEVSPYVCKLCKRRVRTISNIYKHLRSNHFLKENLRDYIENQEGESIQDPNEEIKKKVSEGVIDEKLLNPSFVKSLGSVGKNAKGVPLYNCPVCNKKLLKGSLTNHLKFHNAAQLIHTCPLCPKRYCTRSSLSYHRSTAHPDAAAPLPGSSDSQISSCKACGKKYEGQEGPTHLCTGGEADHTNKVLRCETCHKQFNHRSNLLSHMRAIHGVGSIKPLLNHICPHCSKVFVGRNKLTRHTVEAHDDTLSVYCDWCGKNFATEAAFRKHAATHKKRKRNLQCAFCPRKFYRGDVLRVHEKLHSSPVCCDICGKKFSEVSYRDTHIAKVHNNDRNRSPSPTYRCEVCLLLCKSEDQLKRHTQTHNQSTVQCKICNQAVKVSEFKRHNTLHGKHMPLSCDVCGKEFALETRLERHKEEVHRGSVGGERTLEIMYDCQHCNANSVKTSLSSLFLLKKHLEKHKCPGVLNFTLNSSRLECNVCCEDEGISRKLFRFLKRKLTRKIHPCSFCDKKFSQVQEAVNHRVVHTGEKPFTCNLCDERFTQRSSLNTHVKRHKSGTVGQENLRCYLCGKLCKTYSGLTSHVRGHKSGLTKGSNIPFLSLPSHDKINQQSQQQQYQLQQQHQQLQLQQQQPQFIMQSISQLQLHQQMPHSDQQLPLHPQQAAQPILQVPQHEQLLNQQQLPVQLFQHQLQMPQFIMDGGTGGLHRLDNSLQLEDDASQFQVTTISIEGLTSALDYRETGDLIEGEEQGGILSYTLPKEEEEQQERATLPYSLQREDEGILSYSLVGEREEDQLTYKIQIIDDLSDNM